MKKEPEFHYSREERLSLLSAPDLSSRGDKRGVFRRNRTLLIILLDICVVSLLVLIYSRFLYVPPYQGELAGVLLVLNAYETEEKCLGILTVKRVDEPEREGAVQMRVVFRRAGEQVQLTETLPPGLGDNVEIPVSFPRLDQAGTVDAEIRIGEEVIVLTRKLNGK